METEMDRTSLPLINKSQLFDLATEAKSDNTNKHNHFTSQTFIGNFLSLSSRYCEPSRPLDNPKFDKSFENCEKKCKPRGQSLENCTCRCLRLCHSEAKFQNSVKLHNSPRTFLSVFTSEEKMWRTK